MAIFTPERSVSVEMHLHTAQNLDNIGSLKSRGLKMLSKLCFHSFMYVHMYVRIYVCTYVNELKIIYV